MKLSQQIQNIPGSATLAISARAAQLKAEGVDVLSFSAGEPDFSTPDAILDAARAALDEGWTRYTPVGGHPKLKAAIRAWYEKRLGISFSDGEIIASCGAKHSLYNAFIALLDPGDEVLIPTPAWVSYETQVRIAGGEPVLVPGDPSAEFVPSLAALDAATTERTRAIIINNPTNPTGAFWGREQLETLATWLKAHPDIVIISDSIYSELVYDGLEFVELLSVAPELRDRYVLIDGVSKAFAMTGWRLGWTLAPAPLVGAMARLQSQSTSNPTALTQAAAIAALREGEKVIEPMRAAFERRRDLIVDLLGQIPDVTLVRPRGAFYVFPDLSAYHGRKHGDTVIVDDFAMAAYLLDEARVAVVPGSPFGAPGYVRLSYASSEETIREGLARMTAALAALT